MASPRTTTAPTIGLGAVHPQPRRARTSARRMNARSRAAQRAAGRSESTVISKADTHSERPVDARGVRFLVEAVVRRNVATGDIANRCHQLGEPEARGHVEE